MPDHAGKSNTNRENAIDHVEQTPCKPVNQQSMAVQCRFDGNSAALQTTRSGSSQNTTGMPDMLKSGLEQLSGFDLSPVRVHYNSPTPAQVGALAYAHGTHIHLGPGQEKHLPHEGWHVVQQMQGRVRPTTQYKGVGVNDNPALEREADVMGQRAANLNTLVASPVRPRTAAPSSVIPAQLKVAKYRAGAWYSSFDPYTTFWTQKEAAGYDKKLRAQGRAELKARVPTIYTYTHTKPYNQLSSVPQGPHTVAHRVVLQSLIKAKTVQDVLKIFGDQVLTPDVAEKVVFQDEAPPSGSFASAIDARLRRFIRDYTDIYHALKAEFEETSPDMILIKHMTNQLLNMDPYAVYAWKTTSQASKKSLNGKGECLSNPQWSDLYDTPPPPSFRSSENLQSFVNARRNLFNLYMGRSEDSGDLLSSSQRFGSQLEYNETRNAVWANMRYLAGFNQILEQYRVGYASDDGLNCLIHTLIQLASGRNDGDIELREVTAIREQLENQDDNIDIYGRDGVAVLNAIAHTYQPIQIHVIELTAQGNLIDHPAIGNEGPAVYVLHTIHHFTPLFPLLGVGHASEDSDVEKSDSSSRSRDRSSRYRSRSRSRDRSSRDRSGPRSRGRSSGYRSSSDYSSRSP